MGSRGVEDRNYYALVMIFKGNLPQFHGEGVHALAEASLEQHQHLNYPQRVELSYGAEVSCHQIPTFFL